MSTIASDSATSAASQRPVTILFVAANPFFTHYDVEFEEELYRIRTALRKSKYADRINLVEEVAVEFGDLYHLLELHRPDIVHLCVPALPDVGYFFQELDKSKPTVRDAMAGKISTAASANSSKNALADLLSHFPNSITCLFSNTPLAQGAAQDIVRYVGAVIAMPVLAHQDQCLSFAEGFYQSLGTGASLRAALEAAIWKLGNVHIATAEREYLYREVKPYILTNPVNTDLELRWSAAATLATHKSNTSRVLFIGGLSTEKRHGTSLNLGREVRWIREKLRSYKGEREVVFHTEWAVRLHELPDHILFHDPHIVVISGHAGRQGVLLRDMEGRPQMVSAEVLRGTLASCARSVQCLILNGCDTSDMAKEMTEHVDYCIGMDGDIEDNVSIFFSEGFFRGISHNRSIEDSFRLGVEAIRADSLDGHGNRHCQRPKIYSNPRLANKSPAPPVPQTDNKGQAMDTNITSSDIRRLVAQILIGDSDFTAFCIDYFPDIERRFGSSMNRVDKENILLKYAKPSEILVALRRAYPSKVPPNLAPPSSATGHPVPPSVPSPPPSAPATGTKVSVNVEIRWDIFISHAGADSEAAVQLHKFLAAAGLRVFTDQLSLLLGDDWAVEIPRAQKQSRVTVVLVSPRCDRAYYEREEIAAAIALARDERYAHRVVPVFLEGFPTDPGEMPFGLRSKHGLSAPNVGGIGGVAESLSALHNQLTANQRAAD